MPKHEDEMTPGEYRRYKNDWRTNEHGHSHLCGYCEQPWECPQLWHCRRDKYSTCPDCEIKSQAEKDAKRAVDLHKPLTDLLKKTFGG